MVSEKVRVVDEATGISTIDYTGRSVGTVTVVGLIPDWASKDLWNDEIWILHCSEYDCTRLASVKNLRPMLSSKSKVSGRQWDSRYDAMIGVKVEGTSLTIKGHELRPRKKGAKMAYERHFFCECSISGVSRWVTVNDVMSGNTKSFKVKSKMRPEGLLIDPDLDEFIGMNGVYEGCTKNATDGRSVTYYRVTIDGLPQLIHRVAWFVRFGVWSLPSQEIHHKNHNTLDNRIENLELLDRNGVRNNSQSLHKMRKQNGRPVTSKYKGVHWDSSKNKWAASVTFRNKGRFIGRFASESEARDAYDAYVKKLNDEHGCIYTLNSDLHLI